LSNHQRKRIRTVSRVPQLVIRVGDDLEAIDVVDGLAKQTEQVVQEEERKFLTLVRWSCGSPAGVPSVYIGTTRTRRGVR
jgi:hypothetical protein